MNIVMRKKIKNAIFYFSLFVLFLLGTLRPFASSFIFASLFFCATAFVLKQSNFLEKNCERPSWQIVIVSILIGIMMGINFYTVWPYEYIPAKIAGKLNISATALVSIIASIGAIVGAYSLIKIVTAIVASWKIEFSKIKSTKKKNTKNLSFAKALGILFLINIFAISAIIRANANYIDDAGRVVHGYLGWENFSRYLSNDLSALGFAHLSLADASPLLQVIAGAIIALSGVLILTIIHNRKEYSIWEILSVVPLGINPYFLECYSYKFDAPFMALSILASILPLIYRKASTLMYVIASAIGAIMACMSYQASLGIFPMLVILLALRMWLNKKTYKKILIFIVKSVSGYLIGVLFFNLVIMRPVGDSYVSNTLPSIIEFIPNFFSNIYHYYSIIKSDFNVLWLVLIASIICLFFITIYRKTKQNKMATMVTGIASIVAIFLLCFGLYPALTTPLFATRAMYGFCVAIVLLAVMASDFCRKSGYLYAPILALGWSFIIFSFIYGNALEYQKKYETFRRDLIVADLSDINYVTDEKVVTVQLKGDAGHSPVIENTINTYPIIKRLVPVMLRGNWTWGEAELFDNYGLNIVKGDDLDTENLPILKKTTYHSIYGNNEKLLVELK